MCKRSLITITAMTSVLLTLARASFSDDVTYKINYYTQTNGVWAGIASLPGAGKGFDNEKRWPSSSPTGVLLGFYRVAGVDGWNADTGYYYGDIREQLLPGTSVRIDGLYLWATPDTAAQDMRLYLNEPTYLDGLTYSLFLDYVPGGITYGGPRVWTAHHGTIALPFFSTSDGLAGYRFHVELTAIPEPSSLLALVGGLAGAGGFALRRRRK